MVFFFFSSVAWFDRRKGQGMGVLLWSGLSLCVLNKDVVRLSLQHS